MKLIPKGELLSYGFCEFGEEDEQGRYIAEEDLIVLTKEEHDSLVRIAQSAQPMSDALKSVLKSHKELDGIIDTALSGVE